METKSLSFEQMENLEGGFICGGFCLAGIGVAGFMVGSAIGAGVAYLVHG